MYFLLWFKVVCTPTVITVARPSASGVNPNSFWGRTLEGSEAPERRGEGSGVCGLCAIPTVGSETIPWKIFWKFTFNSVHLGVFLASFVYFGGPGGTKNTLNTRLTSRSIVAVFLLGRGRWPLRPEVNASAISLLMMMMMMIIIIIIIIVVVVGGGGDVVQQLIVKQSMKPACAQPGSSMWPMSMEQRLSGQRSRLHVGLVL